MSRAFGVKREGVPRESFVAFGPDFAAVPLFRGGRQLVVSEDTAVLEDVEDADLESRIDRIGSRKRRGGAGREGQGEGKGQASEHGGLDAAEWE